MKRLCAVLMSLALSSMFGSLALADDDPAECAATIKLFQEAGESAGYFKNSYGYAVFPTIGKADSASAEPTGRDVSISRASRWAPPR